MSKTIPLFTALSMMLGFQFAQASVWEPASALRARYFEKPVAVSALMEVPDLDVQLSGAEGSVGRVSYSPSPQTSIGLGIDYGGYGVKLLLPIPRNESEIQRKGDTRHYDFILSKWWEADGVELLFQGYQGFYRISGPMDETNYRSVLTSGSDIGASIISMRSRPTP